MAFRLSVSRIEALLECLEAEQHSDLRDRLLDLMQREMGLGQERWAGVRAHAVKDSSRRLGVCVTPLLCHACSRKAVLQPSIKPGDLDPAMLGASRGNQSRASKFLNSITGGHFGRSSSKSHANRTPSMKEAPVGGADVKLSVLPESKGGSAGAQAAP